jgi:hypothetical protein
VNIVNVKAVWRRAPEYLQGPAVALPDLSNSAESRLNGQGRMTGPLVPLSNSVRSSAGPARTPLTPLHHAPVSSEPNEVSRRNLESLAKQLVARCGNDVRRLRDTARNFERGGVIWNCLNAKADELDNTGSFTRDPLLSLANRLCAGKTADELFQLGHTYPPGSTIRRLALERARMQSRQPFTTFGAGV